jgi:hypothetical protein
VGFVDFGDDFDIPIITGEDDELIDEDDLLTEEDMTRGIVQRRSSLLVFYIQRLTQRSSGVSPKGGKAKACLQRLYLRSERETRSGRH